MSKKCIAMLCIMVLCIIFLIGCGSEKTKEIDVDLSMLYKDILDKTESPEMILLSEKRIMDYYGIDASTCGQAIVAVCGNSLRTDEIWLIEAESDDTANDYLKKAESCIEQKCAANENYLPDQYAVAKQGKTGCYGKYVALFVSPESQTMLDIFNSAFGK